MVWPPLTMSGECHCLGGWLELVQERWHLCIICKGAMGRRPGWVLNEPQSLFPKHVVFLSIYGFPRRNSDVLSPRFLPRGAWPVGDLLAGPSRTAGWDHVPVGARVLSLAWPHMSPAWSCLRFWSRPLLFLWADPCYHNQMPYTGSGMGISVRGRQEERSTGLLLRVNSLPCQAAQQLDLLLSPVQPCSICSHSWGQGKVGRAILCPSLGLACPCPCAACPCPRTGQVALSLSSGM